MTARPVDRKSWPPHRWSTEDHRLTLTLRRAQVRRSGREQKTRPRRLTKRPRGIDSLAQVRARGDRPRFRATLHSDSGPGLPPPPPPRRSEQTPGAAEARSRAPPHNADDATFLNKQSKFLLGPPPGAAQLWQNSGQSKPTAAQMWPIPGRRCSVPREFAPSLAELGPSSAELGPSSAETEQSLTDIGTTLAQLPVRGESVGIVPVKGQLRSYVCSWSSVGKKCRWEHKRFHCIQQRDVSRRGWNSGNHNAPGHGGL